jgi:prephenate dehydratase
VVAEGDRTQAALGTRLAADIYGGAVLREGVQDRDDNVTRFVWLALVERNRADGAQGARACDSPPLQHGGSGWKTSVVFWGPGADSAGWLVRCLDEFARRAINLTKIESRPRREALGHYMFFVDLEGSAEDPTVAAALAGLHAVCEQVRVLGSYRAS